MRARPLTNFLSTACSKWTKLVSRCVPRALASDWWAYKPWDEVDELNSVLKTCDLLEPGNGDPYGGVFVQVLPSTALNQQEVIVPIHRSLPVDDGVPTLLGQESRLAMSNGVSRAEHGEAAHDLCDAPSNQLVLGVITQETGRSSYRRKRKVKRLTGIAASDETNRARDEEDTRRGQVQTQEQTPNQDVPRLPHPRPAESPSRGKGKGLRRPDAPPDIMRSEAQTARDDVAPQEDAKRQRKRNSKKNNQKNTHQTQTQDELFDLTEITDLSKLDLSFVVRRCTKVRDEITRVFEVGRNGSFISASRGDGDDMAERSGAAPSHARARGDDDDGMDEQRAVTADADERGADRAEQSMSTSAAKKA
mmetsp:Transcript_114284/g.308726  ORF Transcript_114284/g.308726 Transcript_114284/m.308726 type:complete len:363 (-) Transcript_114284:37-1125(-)